MRITALLSIALIAAVFSSCGDGSSGERDDLLSLDSKTQDVNGAALWTDSETGLTWQLEASSAPLPWEDAETHCEALSIDGALWRMPNIGELRTLVRGCPAVTSGSDTCEIEPGGCLDNTCDDGDLCETCPFGKGPINNCYRPEEFLGACFTWYWSATETAKTEDRAWGMNFDGAYLQPGLKTIPQLVLCVSEQ